MSLPKNVFARASTVIPGPCSTATKDTDISETAVVAKLVLS